MKGKGRRMKKRKSKKLFSKTSGISKKNLTPRPQRGGGRL